MSKMWRVSITMLIALSLMGCGAKNNDAQNEDMGVEPDTNVTDESNDDSATNIDATNEGDGKLELADDVADKIVEMEEVESANVIVTDANAYVAVVLNDGAEGSDQMENEIADQVRSENADFNNVYVSMNPDFVKQMDEYGNKIRANEPIEGFFEEFTDAMMRVFPDAH